MKAWTKSLLVLLTINLWKAIAYSQPILQLESAKHYQVSIEEGVYGVFREGDKVLTFPRRHNFYIRSRYHADAKEADLGFGSIKNPLDGMERIDIGPIPMPYRIRSFLAWKQWWIFVDSERWNAAVWNKDENRWQRGADFLLDTARPAVDAQGEATRPEVDRLQAMLKASLSKEKENAELLGGMAPMPKRWKDRDGSQFLIWLRLAKAPLLTLACDEKNFSICKVKRVCFIKGLDDQSLVSMSGLSLDPKTQRLLIGNPLNQTVYELKGQGCFRVEAKPLFRYSKDLLDLSSIYVDDDHNLWLSTRRPDLKFSASVFVFGSAVWDP